MGRSFWAMMMLKQSKKSKEINMIEEESKKLIISEGKVLAS